MAEHVLNISEVGFNYNGSLDCAFVNRRAAKAAGV